MSNMSLITVTSIVNFMFFASGIDKILHFDKVVNGLEKRLNAPKIILQLMILSAIAIEIISPIIILWSVNKPKYRYLGRYCIYSLIIFTIAATLIYHFPPTGIRWYPFSSNITTIGGLIACSMLLKDT